MFSKIRRVVFIGGNRFKEDGPMLEFIDVCIKSNIACDVISDQDRLFYPTESMGTLSECLYRKGIKFISIDNLSVEISSKLISDLPTIDKLSTNSKIPGTTTREAI